MRPSQSCSVCSANTQYSFYGVIACDPCRVFFRRRVLTKRVSNSYVLSLIHINDFINRCLLANTMETASYLLFQQGFEPVVSVVFKSVFLWE